MTSSCAEIRRARPLLGTIVEIAATGVNANAATNAAFLEVETIHRLMSFHERDSDLARINRAPVRTPVTVDARTYEVLAFAQSLSEMSRGAFDVTMGATLVTAGLLPPPAQSDFAAPEADYRDVELLPNRQVLLRRRLWVDLGGIAKGYAVDRAVAVLQARGARAGSVNAGGDLRLFGAAQPVHLRHPQRSDRLIPLGPMSNRAVASSSGAFAEPLVNPRARRCERWGHGVTVIARDCISADALTKVVRLAPQRVRALLTRFEAQALIVDQQGARFLDSAPRPQPRNQRVTQ